MTTVGIGPRLFLEFLASVVQTWKRRWLINTVFGSGKGGLRAKMRPGVYAKEFRRQAASFRVLSKLIRTVPPWSLTGEPDIQQLIESAVAEGLAEVCDLMAALKEVSS